MGQVSYPDPATTVNFYAEVGGEQTFRKIVGRFYELVKQFYEKTGVPILLNTSFNRMGQPIIETPTDAIECLLNTGLDCCVFEDRIVFKK